MKISLPVLLLSIILSAPLIAQRNNGLNPGLPADTPGSVLFGKDIVINDQPAQNQQGVTICSAFNGWLYSAYSHNNPDNMTSVTIMKSTDNGISWIQLFDGSVGMIGITIPKVELLVCGTTEFDIKLFLGMLYCDTTFNSTGAAVDRLDGNTGFLEEVLFEDGSVRDFALAQDNLFPAMNANPFSIGLLFSKVGYADSLILKTSGNGGVSFNSQKIVALEPHNSTDIFKKVALSYGICMSKNTGRYFAAWEKQNKYSTSNLGHIFTAHSEPYFNSEFTSPVCLDNLDPAITNRCNTPVISCQTNNIDNDSSSLTEIVIFQKYLQGSNEADLQGCFNLQSTASAYFKMMTLDGSTDTKSQPDICFNPYDSKFLVTYFNASSHLLPYLTNQFNLTAPDTWEVVTTGYNDHPDVESPNPKVEINYLQHSGVNVWLENRYGANNSSMFDAQYSTYTGYARNLQLKNDLVIHLFPNPCNTSVTMQFKLPDEEIADVIIFDPLGNTMESERAEFINAGIHEYKFNVSNFPTGCYFYKVETKHTISSGKLLVVR